MPFRAALMAASVPVKVMLASPVPVPAEKARPAVPARVSVPLVAVSVTCSAPPAASGSETEIALPLAVGERHRRVDAGRLRPRRRHGRRLVGRRR